jgi:hypothetical protein
MDNKSLWPITFASNDHQPLAITTIPTSNYSDVVFGCKDGYLRTFDNTTTDDDSEDIESDILIGPFHVSQEYGMDGMVKEMRADFADNTTSLTWKLYTADTAEEAVDDAVADLGAGTETNLNKKGTWAANHNTQVYPRARGSWCVLWISGTSKWSYEKVTMILAKLGRIR